MDKYLNELAEKLSANDCEKFERAFEDFAGSAEISDDMKMRILSSVRRKAGLSMDGNITVSSKKKYSKRMIGIILAAAAALTSAVGVYAYEQFLNRNTVENYIEDVEKLEENGFVENQIVENEHIRITMDTLLSDGYNAYVVFTKKALDDVGREYLKDYIIDNSLRYADTGEALSASCQASEQLDTDEPDAVKCFQLYDLDGIDTSRKIEFIFYTLDLTAAEGISSESFDEYGIPESNLFGHDMTAEADLSPNCETKTLTAENGKTVQMSNFEIVCGKDVNLNDSSAECEVRLIKKDGSYETTNNEKKYVFDGVSGDTPSKLLFGKFIDLDDYIGAEINGVEYFAEK